MNEILRKWLPQDRRLAQIEACALTILVVFVIFRWLTAPVGVALATGSHPVAPEMYAVVGAAEREALVEVFPGPAGSGQDRVEVLAEVMEALAAMNLQLDTRQVQSTSSSGEFPPRQRVRLVVRGRAQDQANFVRFLTHTRLPISIHAFDWADGKGPEDRRLELQLDFLFASPKP